MQENQTCTIIKPYNRSCDGTVLPVPKEEKVLDIKDLAPDLLKQMQDYAVTLRKRHPKMKPQRAQQLVARKFNIKLI